MSESPCQHRVQCWEQRDLSVGSFAAVYSSFQGSTWSDITTWGQLGFKVRCLFGVSWGLGACDEWKARIWKIKRCFTRAQIKERKGMELSYGRIKPSCAFSCLGSAGSVAKPVESRRKACCGPYFAHLCHTHFQGPLTAFRLLSTREKSFQGLQSTPLSQRERRKGKSGYVGTC